MLAVDNDKFQHGAIFRPLHKRIFAVREIFTRSISGAGANPLRRMGACGFSVTKRMGGFDLEII